MIVGYRCNICLKNPDETAALFSIAFLPFARKSGERNAFVAAFSLSRRLNKRNFPFVTDSQTITAFRQEAKCCGTIGWGGVQDLWTV